MNATAAASQLFRAPGGVIFSGDSRGSRVRLSGLLPVFALAAGLALASASECSSVTHLPSLLYGAVLWIWWALIASTLWMLSRRWPVVTSFSPSAIAAHVVVGSVLGSAHLFLLWSICYPPEAQTEAARHYLFNINRFGIEILLYGFVFGITGIIQFQFRAQREAIHSLELERQLSAAHLHALQMQLEPHFLFNTLNAITTLVELDRKQQAAEMLTHLNAILKTTLRRSAPEKVPLAQELEIVENYLAIEQVRFADRLRLDLRVDPSALDALIPCFLLQPIVENAIRHGIAGCEEEGRIETTARREGASLHLCVRDTGSSPTGASAGHGARHWAEEHTSPARAFLSAGPRYDRAEARHWRI